MRSPIGLGGFFPKEQSKNRWSELRFWPYPWLLERLPWWHPRCHQAVLVVSNVASHDQWVWCRMGVGKIGELLKDIIYRDFKPQSMGIKVGIMVKSSYIMVADCYILNIQIKLWSSNLSINDRNPHSEKIHSPGIFTQYIARFHVGQPILATWRLITKVTLDPQLISLDLLLSRCKLACLGTPNKRGCHVSFSENGLAFGCLGWQTTHQPHFTVAMSPQPSKNCSWLN